MTPYLKTGRQTAFITILSFIAISLFVGNGVITPAISILSAVEGILLMPGFEGMRQSKLILIAALIAILLFAFQKRGTERVAWGFDPLMRIWFFVLAISGIASLLHFPSIFWAVNPYYGLKFIYSNGFAGFLVLIEVIDNKEEPWLISGSQNSVLKGFCPAIYGSSIMR